MHLIIKITIVLIVFFGALEALNIAGEENQYRNIFVYFLAISITFLLVIFLEK